MLSDTSKFLSKPNPIDNWQLQPTLTDDWQYSWVWLCFHAEQQEEQQEEEEEEQPHQKN